MNPVAELRRKTGLTQARLAELGGTSQPTIAAYEAGRKSPTIRTLARLADGAGLELATAFVPPLTREDRRSIALHQAIASRLEKSPAAVLRRADHNLAVMATRHPGAARLFDHWRVILRLPVPDIAEILVDPRSWARDLRQVTPFAGVLSAAERTEVYRSFAEAERVA